MKRVYKINFKKKIYEVEVEEVTPLEKKKTVETRFTSSSFKKTTQPVTQEKKNVVTDANVVVSPMSGSIISIAVKIGDVVKEGALLLKLEAMKMESSINSFKDGKIIEIYCDAGQNVSADEPLLKLE